MQCQQLPWKMETKITSALICNSVLPGAAHLPLHLTWPTSIPPGKTKHPAHWFCSTLGFVFFLNSYTSWLLRHQFSSFPNTSMPSADFTFFWWWLTCSGGPLVTVSPSLVWQIPNSVSFSGKNPLLWIGHLTKLLIALSLQLGNNRKTLPQVFVLGIHQRFLWSTSKSDQENVHKAATSTPPESCLPSLPRPHPPKL